MTISAQALGERLAPLRESNVTALLEAQARALRAGAEIEAEPARRGPDGEVWRGGLLDLPERGDLAVTLDGHTVIQRIEATQYGGFAPADVYSSPGFVATVAPFYWHRAPLILSADVRQPDWRPLRHWFLEWFQPRQTELSPELGGVVHSLEGPVAGRFGWRAEVDLGSAPVASVAALIAAAAQTGCSRVSIGVPRG